MFKVKIKNEFKEILMDFDNLTAILHFLSSYINRRLDNFLFLNY
jgi:hypothetical protein